MSKNIFERPPKAQRRVVVTGLGSVSPVGNTTEESWDNLVHGRSGIDKISHFDVSEYDSQIAGEVKNFDVDQFITKKEQKKMDRFIHLALGATDEAIKDAGLENMDDNLKQRTGTIVGVGIGGLPMIEKQSKLINERGPGRISPFLIPGVISNLAAGQISIKYGFEGPNLCTVSACASGAHSIGEAARYIRDGHCDVMVAGGAESAISPVSVGGFAAMRALSTRNSAPQQASRPWDQDRDGFVLSEGSGLLILEDYEHASNRGAKIYGELTGYGVSADAHHISSPAPEGSGAALAMYWAITDAGIGTEEIDYINAHGTSTPVGDEVEVKAIKNLFKDHAKNLWVSSTKSMTGHTLGAAGALESVFSILSLKNNVAPPTINLENPSEACDLDFVANEARERPMNHVMNNSFGFGGTNACLIFSRLSES